MYKKIAKFILFLLTISLPLHAEGDGEIEYNLWDDEDADRTEFLQYQEDLAQRRANPTDINLVTRPDLQALGFLNDDQIEDILRLVFLVGPLRSMAELMAVPSLSRWQRQQLSLYFYADGRLTARPDTLSLRQQLKNAKHRLSTRLDIPLYYRRGYSVSDENGGYQGNPLYNKISYRMDAGKHIALGVRAEKDAGEPFLHNGGWDSYGGALQLKQMGVLENLVVGDYKLGFGMGLVVNQGYGFGKQNAWRTATGIKPHFGTDEIDFMRGAAATLRLGKHWALSAWASHRKRDATLTDEGYVQTLRTSGLHRTISETDNKNNVRSTTAGANLDWKNRGFNIGATAYFQHFNRTLEPGNQLYRTYYPRGNRFFLGGVHYGWSNTYFTISGETATNGESRGVATLNQVNWRLSTNTTITVLQRHYGRAYSSFYSSALSDRGSVQNESGGLLRLETRIFWNTQLLTYFDVFRNEWPARGDSIGRRGQDFLIQTTTPIGKSQTLQIRYQLKRRGTPGDLPIHHRLRLRYNWQTTAQWTLHWLANLHALEGETGYSISQGVKHQSKNKQWRQALTATWFHTPSYDTRVYVLEPTLRSTFSIPALSGKGVRAVVTAQASLFHSHLLVEARYAMTRMIGASTIGSGMDLINSPWRNDISVQLTLNY